MEYVICYFRDMKLGHILGTRSIKTAGFSWDLQGISIEENAYKSSNTKASWKLLTIAKTRDRKLEIKCGDEPPWVRIPPSLPLKNKASWRFPRSLFCLYFWVKNTILGTRDFEHGFWGKRNRWLWHRKRGCRAASPHSFVHHFLKKRTLKVMQTSP